MRRLSVVWRALLLSALMMDCGANRGRSSGAGPEPDDTPAQATRSAPDDGHGAPDAGEARETWDAGTEETEETDAGSAGDAGPTKDGGGLKLGEVEVVQRAWRASAFGFFYEGRISIRDAYYSGCERTEAGPCEVFDCAYTPRDGGTSDAGSPWTLRNAGEISISGTPVDGGIRLNYVRDGYEPFITTDWLLDGGELLSVSSTGGEVPELRSPSVAAPAPLRLTAPDCRSGYCTGVSPSEPLTLRWTGGVNGIAEVTLHLDQPRVKQVTVYCEFPAGDGAGVVPASLMGKLRPPSFMTLRGALIVVPSNATEFSTGDWKVTLRAENVGTEAYFLISN